MLDHYRGEGLVATIDGVGTIDEIPSRMLGAIEHNGARRAAHDPTTSRNFRSSRPRDRADARAGKHASARACRSWRAVRAGVTTLELDRERRGLIRDSAAFLASWATTASRNSICVSINDEAVHGIPGNRR